MTNRRGIALLGGTLSLGAALAACSSKQATVPTSLFATDWQNDQGVSIAEVRKRLGDSAPPAGTPIALGITGKKLIGQVLDKKARWTYAVELDSRPVISGDVVVGTGAGRLFALDARTGKPLWNMPSSGRRLRGAGDDGAITAVTLSHQRGLGSLLLAIGRKGEELARIETSLELGTPAIVSGVALVPWGNQYVSAIDVREGEEIGRLLMREKVSHALNVAGALYFGELGLLRFDEQVAGARLGEGQANHVTLPERELPGKPNWFEDGARAMPRDSSARDRIRLYARPGKKSEIDSNRYAATYFRIVVGLDAKTGKLSWVRTLPRDIVAGSAAIGGFVFCDTAGNLWLAEAIRGGAAGELSLGEPLSACVVQTAAYAVEGGAAAQALATQISGAIAVREAEMATMQRFLLRELGTLEDASVTKTLIDLAADPLTPQPLLAETRSLLAARRSGANYMLEALARNYDFLSDVLRPPPIGPLADALAAMNEKRAAPLLARHLNDPANPPDDVERAAQALEKLASASELDELEIFFALYRATADEDEVVRAVLSVARAIVRIGGAHGESIIRQAAQDPLTHPEVKRGLAAVVPAGAQTEKSDAQAG